MSPLAVEVENRIGSPRLLVVASIVDGSNVERAVNMDLHLFLRESALSESWRSL